MPTQQNLGSLTARSFSSDRYIWRYTKEQRECRLPVQSPVHRWNFLHALQWEWPYWIKPFTHAIGSLFIQRTGSSQTCWPSGRAPSATSATSWKTDSSGSLCTGGTSLRWGRQRFQSKTAISVQSHSNTERQACFLSARRGLCEAECKVQREGHGEEAAESDSVRSASRCTSHGFDLDLWMFWMWPLSPPLVP